jgi:ribose transport system ATP-binding protein
MAAVAAIAVPARLEMRGVEKRFGGTVALAGADFSVAPGEVHALLGENGAGKSTLMKVLSGAERPDTGTMTLDGSRFAPRDPLDARRAGVAIVYQELAIAPHLTVAENMLLGAEPAWHGVIDTRRLRERAQRILLDLGHADIPPEARAGSLSVGAQQLVEIARALALESRVLVLDEPTSSLAREDAVRLFCVVRRLRDQGLSIVYISHFLEEVQHVADRFTVLRDGRAVGSGPVAGTEMSEIVRLMLGRSFDQLFERSPREPGETVLEVTDLSGFSRLVGGSLRLRRGEVLGLAGLVGAGRTELLRAIFGLDPVRRGAIRVGVHTGPATPGRRLGQGIGLLSEDRKAEGLATGLSVAENMTLSRSEGLGPWSLVMPARQDQVARTWVGRLGIRCAGPRQRVAELSGGNQQKVALARLLHHDVDVFLLDEPTRGIDVASKSQIYSLIDGLAARGKAVLLVSSHLPELLSVCDNVIVIHRGRTGETRPARDWTETSLMLHATGAAQAGSAGATS